MKDLLILLAVLIGLAIVQATGFLKLQVSAQSPCVVQLFAPDNQMFEAELSPHNFKEIHVTVSDANVTAIAVGVEINGYDNRHIFLYPLEKTWMDRIAELPDCSVAAYGIFECDIGFVGPKCAQKSKKRCTKCEACRARQLLNETDGMKPVTQKAIIPNGSGQVTTADPLLRIPHRTVLAPVRNTTPMTINFTLHGGQIPLPRRSTTSPVHQKDPVFSRPATRTNFTNASPQASIQSNTTAKTGPNSILAALFPLPRRSTTQPIRPETSVITSTLGTIKSPSRARVLIPPTPGNPVTKSINASLQRNTPTAAKTGPNSILAGLFPLPRRSTVQPVLTEAPFTPATPVIVILGPRASAISPTTPIQSSTTKTANIGSKVHSTIDVPGKVLPATSAKPLEIVTTTPVSTTQGNTLTSTTPALIEMTANHVKTANSTETASLTPSVPIPPKKMLEAGATIFPSPAVNTQPTATTSIVPTDDDGSTIFGIPKFAILAFLVIGGCVLVIVGVMVIAGISHLNNNK